MLSTSHFRRHSAPEVRRITLYPIRVRLPKGSIHTVMADDGRAAKFTQHFNLYNELLKYIV